MPVPIGRICEHACACVRPQTATAYAYIRVIRVRFVCTHVALASLRLSFAVSRRDRNFTPVGEKERERERERIIVQRAIYRLL